MKLYTI